MSFKVDDLYVDFPHMVVDCNDLANLLTDYLTETADANILEYAIQWARDNFEADNYFYGERLAMRLNALMDIAPELPPDVCRFSTHAGGKNYEFSSDLLAAAAVTPLLPSDREPCVFEKAKLLHNARVYTLRLDGMGDGKGKPS